MTNKLQFSLKNKIFSAMLCALFACAIMFSCSKPDPANKKFIGTWSDGTITITLAAGSDDSHLTQQAELDYSTVATGSENGSCAKAITLTYSVSGSSIVATTSDADNCTSGTLSISGTLNGSTLTFSSTETANGNNSTSTYTLTKQ